MALLYAAAGANHLIHPEVYRQIMPEWVPLHEAMIFISGIFEIAFALMLLFPLTRRISAWLIILLLIAVFPANIQMMLDYLHEHKPGLWLTVLRLPLQFVLIWWAYSFTKPLSLDKPKIN
jgi:uncharacterized membrane protein